MAPILTPYSYGTTSMVWDNWTTTSATSVTYVWNTWNADSTTGTIDTWPGWVSSVYNQSPPVAAAPLTPEQIEARRVAVEARAVEAAERQEVERVKRERAKKLLDGALARKQQKELREHGYFHVETRDGTRRYRLAPGSPPRRVHGEDGRQWSYCIHPDYGYPPEDVTLAQKLLLETDEEAFLRIANASAIMVVGAEALVASGGLCEPWRA